MKKHTELSKEQYALSEAETVSPQDVTVFTYYKYWLLSKISFGKTRREYAAKGKLIKHLLQITGKIPSCGLSEESLKKLIAAIKRYYVARGRKVNWISNDELEYLASEGQRQDFESLLFGRLNGDRRTVVPWLDSIRPLKGATVLEVGCGTGCSTVALGEKGAKVIGIDVSEESIELAKERCAIHGIKDVEFKLIGAAQMGDAFDKNQFDHVIFFASMEHMTHRERVQAIQTAYELIRDNGIVSVVECPNRLWFKDTHTSFTPFFHWLSDECAMDYAKFTPRESHVSDFKNNTDSSPLEFARLGRGVSFHEFVIALGGMENVKVVSHMQAFLDRKLIRRLARKALIVVRTLLGNQIYKYQRLLMKVGPNGIHEGFYEENLDIALKK